MFGFFVFMMQLGIQVVLFPWLIIVELNENARSLGIAQMSTQLPGLVLILFGGLLADRIDPRKILLVAQCLIALAPLMLAYFVSTDQLSYQVLICYAVLLGAGVAFIQPARDSLLNVLASGGLQRTVTISMGLGFAGQGVGFVIASFAEEGGAAFFLIIQAALLLIAAFASINLTPNTRNMTRFNHNALAEIRAGYKVVFESEYMRTTFLLLTLMSVFFGGSFMVLNPIIVRDVYSGGAREISSAFAVFMLGMVAISIVLVVLGGIRNQGRGLLLALMGGAIIWGSVSLHLSYQLYLLALFCWGLTGGVVMSMGRSIMQINAPEQYRARVMAFFSIASLGGMPIGALIMGFSAEAIGPINSIYIASGGITLAVCYFFFTTNIATAEKSVSR